MSKRKKYIELKKIEPKPELPQVQSWQEVRDKEIELRFSVKPLNAKQERYINAIETSVLTFSVGPAGTGRTYVACGVAARLLKEKKVDKIVLTRPIVECGGEKIGFLPGNAAEKVIPYFHPMIDALEEFFGEKEVQHLIHKEIIRLAPLAQMRGSSFKNSIVILDEAQNCNMTQLVMALTRIGQKCTMVVNGDFTQSDLSYRDNSLIKIINKLKVLPEVSIIKFTRDEIVRSGIVKAILDALEQ